MFSKGFLVFSGSTKLEHWPEMGQMPHKVVILTFLRLTYSVDLRTENMERKVRLANLKAGSTYQFHILENH